MTTRNVGAARRSNRRPVLPDSLTRLLTEFSTSFTAPTFVTFMELVFGQVMALGPRTVCGCFSAAGMRGHWSRAHRFFSRAVWSPDTLGLTLLRVIITRLVPAGATVRLVVDGSFFQRHGRRVFQAFYQYNATSGSPGRKLGYGNGWVVLGVLVDVSFTDRSICLPVLARLQRKSTPARKARTHSQLARELIACCEAEFPDRRFLVCADAAFKLDALVSTGTHVIVRSSSTGVFYAPPAPIVGPRGRGRPRVRGERLGTPAQIAVDDRYPWRAAADGSGDLVKSIACRRKPSRGLPLTLTLVLGADQQRKRPAKRRLYSIALVCTDPDLSAEEVREAYADRWAIEVCFQEAKHITGVGQQRNRTRKAVLRAVPFGLITHSLALVWYATSVNHEAELAEHNDTRGWYEKESLSTADALARLRFEILATQFHTLHAEPPTTPKIGPSDAARRPTGTLIALSSA